MDGLRKQARQARDPVRNRRLGFLEDPVNRLHRFPQVCGGPVFGSDHLFPVPLIHIQGMQVVRHLVPADRIHIGIKAAAGPDPITAESMPFPLGQGVDDFGLPPAVIPHVKDDRPLHPVQIIVEPGFRPDKQRRGHTGQGQRVRQPVFKGILKKLDGPFGFGNPQPRAVSLRDFELITAFIHADATPSCM